MSSGARIKSIGAVGVVALMALLLALFRLSEGSDVRYQGELTAEIRELRRLDTELEKLVLKSRFGILTTYDPIVAIEDRIERSVARLHKGLDPASSTGPVSRELLGSVRDAIDVKMRQLEDFKSENAVLGNLTHFFPSIVESAVGSVSEDEQRLLEEITDLVGSAIRLVAHADTGDAEFGERLESLEKSAVASDGEHVKALIGYASRLAERMAVTDGHISELLASPLRERLLGFERSLHAGFIEDDLSARRNRILLLALALVLTAVAASFGVRVVDASLELRAVNANLEERIAVRTRELADRAEELEREVTVRRRTEEELVQKNRELDEFGYVASHDLQEPIRKLISFSGMLAEDVGDDLNDRAREDLGFIVDAAQRMQALVQDLLALSRAGKKALRSEPVALDQCVDHALSALSVRVEETNAEIVREELPTVVGDATMLTQLFQNLIGNALKFTRDGVRPRVTLTSSRRDDVEVVRVEDNGIGIDPKYAETIFAPFKRLHGRSEYEGTGIGLAICAKTVTRHGGSISVESEAGEGAAFLIALPVDEGALVPA